MERGLSKGTVCVGNRTTNVRHMEVLVLRTHGAGWQTNRILFYQISLCVDCDC
jgi:hypothetical protein